MGLSSQIKTIDDIASYQLCCGCGLCVYLDPDNIEMIDTVDFGRRPRLKNQNLSTDCREVMAACPGIGLEHTFDTETPDVITDLLSGWGPILEVWEGYAADPEIRFQGSSGGAATALALHGLEQGGMAGALHVAPRSDVPYLNHTVMSTSREQLLAAAGSRYAPASPCDGLRMIEEAAKPCVFIGKPCDVAATRKAMALRSTLRDKVGLTISLFCAGTPSTKGTLAMTKTLGANDPQSVTGVRYRGCGWPGMAAVTYRENGSFVTQEITYEQSWGEILQKYRQWRCYICPDHTGEFADISVGDPWYRDDRGQNPGQSLILVRTETGRKILRSARESGALVLEPVSPETLPASQPGLLKSRGSLWGRLMTLRLMGVPVPLYRQIPLFSHWWRQLTPKEKAKSFFGTVKRRFFKKLKVRQTIEVYHP
jgi:coenzyme F420 hydrogenase subunit beta